jgi:hypothetical protein
MDFLHLNLNIRTKTTYIIPVLFGEFKYENKRLFSYSIYEKHKIKEVRFESNTVLIYSFDENKNLKRIEEYDKFNKLIKETKIEIIKREPDEIIIHDWTVGGRVPNVGTISTTEFDKISLLRFHRVNSFLGYKSKVKIIDNNEGLVQETMHFERGDLSKMLSDKPLFSLLYKYEMKVNTLDTICMKILNDGWGLSIEEQNIITNYSN